MWRICGCRCRSHGTRDSASHEDTRHLAQWHNCPLLPLTLGFLEHSGLRTTRASKCTSICPFPSPSVLFLTDLLPWTEVVVDFSSYSFLRLRWRDKVLGGKPNSRLQGCRILTLTETNPKTEEGREGGETKGLGSRSYRV